MSKQQKIIIIEALLRLFGDEILTVQERWNLLAHIVLVLTGENIRDILANQNSAHKLQLKRGTTGENDAYTGLAGELTMDTDTNTLRIHDGETPGGHVVAGGSTDVPDTTLPENIDYVVEWQNPTVENNYTWYRKYASGWVEQGGMVPGNIGTAGDIALPIEFSSTNYTVTTSTFNTAASNFFNIDIIHSTTTAIHWVKSSSGIGGSWLAYGYAA